MHGNEDRGYVVVRVLGIGNGYEDRDYEMGVRRWAVSMRYEKNEGVGSIKGGCMHEINKMDLHGKKIEEMDENVGVWWV